MKEAEGDGQRRDQLFGDGRLVHVIDAKQPDISGNERNEEDLRILFNRHERVSKREGTD